MSLKAKLRYVVWYVHRYTWFYSRSRAYIVSMDCPTNSDQDQLFGSEEHMEHQILAYQQLSSDFFYAQRLQAELNQTSDASLDHVLAQQLQEETDPDQSESQIDTDRQLALAMQDTTDSHHTHAYINRDRLLALQLQDQLESRPQASASPQRSEAQTEELQVVDIEEDGPRGHQTVMENVQEPVPEIQPNSYPLLPETNTRFLLLRASIDTRLHQGRPQESANNTTGVPESTPHAQDSTQIPISQSLELDTQGKDGSTHSLGSVTEHPHRSPTWGYAWQGLHQQHAAADALAHQLALCTSGMLNLAPDTSKDEEVALRLSEELNQVHEDTIWDEEVARGLQREDDETQPARESVHVDASSSQASPTTQTYPPPSWWTQCPNCPPDMPRKYHMIDVPQWNEEWIRTAAPLLRAEYTVTQVQRIQNSALWNRLQFEKQLMSHGRQAGFDANQKLLYHTSSASKEVICEEGLDQRLSRHGRFGRGIYFSDNPVKCNQYWHHRAQRGSNPPRCMFACYVLLGDIKEYPRGVTASNLQREPLRERQEPGKPKTYDSVMGNVTGQDEYVVYNTYRVLPVYVLEYKL